MLTVSTMTPPPQKHAETTKLKTTPSEFFRSGHTHVKIQGNVILRHPASLIVKHTWNCHCVRSHGRSCHCRCLGKSWKKLDLWSFWFVWRYIWVPKNPAFFGENQPIREKTGTKVKQGPSGLRGTVCKAHHVQVAGFNGWILLKHICHGLVGVISSGRHDSFIFPWHHPPNQ